MPGEPLPQIDALIALGFQLADDGVLTAPASAVVTLASVGQFFELRISLESGNTIVAVLSKTALKFSRAGGKL